MQLRLEVTGFNRFIEFHEIEFNFNLIELSCTYVCLCFSN